ncbi:hypothetical protein [Lentisalinibacter sediminis]|uniref:hypothetical protein n=1 Tax=Lentisalinibacter sediminis TaxID=2992237 RepID=UPI00386A250A
MQTRHYTLSVLAALFLAAQPSAPALAHGEVDSQHLAQFHLHLDDYEEEIEALITDARNIANARADGRGDGSGVDELIEHWEEVGVHAAIETKATVTYPDIWQALVAFRQAIEKNRSADALAAAARDLEAALWQGYGALRLAAADADDETG